MARPRPFALLAVVLVAAAVAGCGPFGDSIDGSHRDLGAAVQRSGDTGRPFRLASVTDFEWDRVHVFDPYSDPGEITDELGFDWEGADDTAIDSADWINLLVFVRDGDVVRAFEHALGHGDLACLDRRNAGRSGLTRDEAVLRTERLTHRGSEPYDVVVVARPDTARERRLVQRCLRLH